MADTHANLMHTFNFSHEFQVSWRIDNFKRTPNLFQGPPFFPIPGSAEKFCFEIESVPFSDYISLCVYLRKLDVRKVSFNVDCNLTFGNINDKTCFSLKSLVDEVKERSLLGIENMLKISSNKHVIIDHFFKNKGCELLEDKLVVKGKLIFSGVVNSILRPRFVEQSSSDLDDLSKALKAMYRSGLDSDVTIRIGEKTVLTHKSILRSRSPVFAKMFVHSMQESHFNTINITDVNFQVFDCFILYLYTGKLEDKNWNMVFSLYSVADKYEVKGLQRACSRILGTDLSVDSVCSVLLLSFMHSDEELKYCAKVFICEHFGQISKKSEWVDIVATKPQLASEVLGFVTALYAK